MTDENIAQNTAPATVAPLTKQTPVFGILSIVFGGIALMPFLGIISPIGLILGIIALYKKENITGIIGTSISGLAAATSPILWAIVICGIHMNSHTCKTPTPASPSAVTYEQPEKTAPDIGVNVAQHTQN
jgi:hypothetical protein